VTDEMDIGFSYGNLGKRGHLKEVGVNGKTTLKRTLKSFRIYVAQDRRDGGFLCTL
jgi:hypothetical protein